MSAYEKLNKKSGNDYHNANDFNPWKYIRQKVGDYVSLLPTAAVCACKSEEECQDLIDSVKHLL